MPTLGVTFYPHGLSYSTVTTLGQLAEDQGFDGVFVVEGGVNNDVMAMVQAIAMRTRRITVGTNIANLYLRHPATLGAGAVAIAELSRGRLVLGIGVNNPGMLASLGITSRPPRAALRETTEWLRQVFAGHTPPSIHTPFRPAPYPIPLHFAGVALETAELAGEIADGLMCYLASAPRLQQATARMQRGAQQAGRDPQLLTVSLLIPTFLSDDLPAARAAARQFLAFYASLPVYANMFRRSGFAQEMESISQALARGEPPQAIAACISDQFMDAVCLVGPLSRCQEHLAALREAGLSYPLLAPQAIKEDPAAAVQHFLEIFNI
jgi:alkanesulfonate monooxygenase SsuD/methylene tetrahydromethanopterin reductase-like flavin-dependent oxidoreductase (luciferase family)